MSDFIRKTKGVDLTDNGHIYINTMATFEQSTLGHIGIFIATH